MTELIWLSGFYCLKMYKNYFNHYQERLIGLSAEHLFGSERFEYAESEVVVLCLVKNGEQYIKEFISHYFKLGVKHIVFLDNGSTDRTIEIAKDYDKVTILKTDFPFAKRNNMRMRDYLINRFAKNRWSLCVDIDEFFDYPFSGILNLEGLINYLNKNNYTAVATQMLDMFPEDIARGRKNKFLRNEHRYYCLDDLVKKDYYFESGSFDDTCIKVHFGGVRKDLFNISDLCLTKHALIFKDKDTKRGNFGHLLNKGKIADFSAVLFHYKFIDYFFEQVKNAVRQEQYYNHSEEYKKYYNILKKTIVLKLKKENSVNLKNIGELVSANFLVISEKYKNFAENFLNSSGLNSEKEDVAVIIGVKDRLDFRLENAFESLRSQDYCQSLIKIILVDYGSKKELSEEFEKLCKKYNSEYVKVDGVSVWNRARALNIGIKRAGTKYVLCSDVDIIFEENYISECVEELQKNPQKLIWSTMLDLPEGGAGSELDIKEYAKLKKNSISRNQLQCSNYPYGMSINITLTKYYFDINGFDEYYTAWGCEDDDIIKRFKILGLEVVNIFDRTSYVHQWHLMYEGLREEDMEQIEINREYFKNINTLLRNEGGWGIVDYKRENIKDLAAVCCYFNPCRYSSKLENYKIFRQGIGKAGVKLLTVELAFGDNPYELSGFPDVFQIRTGKENIMWQKEALLNMGIKKLIRDGYKKIAWLDADIVFEDDTWAADLSKELDKHRVVQVFSEIYRERDRDIGAYSFGCAKHRQVFNEISAEVARPGGGWAARLSVLENVALYDCAIVRGENDVLIFYASLLRDMELTETFIKYRYFTKLTLPLLMHYRKWARQWYGAVQGSVGFINHKIKILYHGKIKNRRYGDYDIYKNHHFDPEKDIKIGESGAFEWASNKPEFQKEVMEYFYSRKEDE